MAAVSAAAAGSSVASVAWDRADALMEVPAAALTAVAAATVAAAAAVSAAVEVPVSAAAAVAAAAAGSAVAFGALLTPAALTIVAAAVSAVTADLAFGVFHGRTSAAADTSDTAARGAVDTSQRRHFRLLSLYQRVRCTPFSASTTVGSASARPSGIGSECSRGCVRY